ncbi:hypothetical protein L1887_56013 [Cichorium endivia]|nr:hypothetical protein L1887_56013 [Cichorium endivia]
MKAKSAVREADDESTAVEDDVDEAVVDDGVDAAIGKERPGLLGGADVAVAVERNVDVGVAVEEFDEAVPSVGDLGGIVVGGAKDAGDGGEGDVLDDLGDPVVGKDDKDHETNDGGVAGAGARSLTGGLEALVGGDDDPARPCAEGGLYDEAGESDDVYALVLVCCADDGDEEHLCERDALAHEEVGDDAEYGKDGEDDGGGGVSAHPEVDAEGDVAEGGEEQSGLEDELWEGVAAQADDGEGDEAAKDEQEEHEEDGIVPLWLWLQTLALEALGTGSVRRWADPGRRRDRTSRAAASAGAAGAGSRLRRRSIAVPWRAALRGRYGTGGGGEIGRKVRSGLYGRRMMVDVQTEATTTPKQKAVGPRSQCGMQA